MLRYYVLIEVCNGEHVVVGVGNVNSSASEHKNWFENWTLPFGSRFPVCLRVEKLHQAASDGLKTQQRHRDGNTTATGAAFPPSSPSLDAGDSHFSTITWTFFPF